MPDVMGPNILLPPQRTDSLAATGMDSLPTGPALVESKYNEAHLLDLFQRYKKECFEYRWVWEREWLRDIYYVNNRQWVYWHPTRREWLDKRFNKDIPRPVTNKLKEVLVSLRANMGAIHLGVLAHPIGNNPESVGAAEIAGKIAPLLHDEHQMTKVMNESDFWYIVTGNAALQVSWDTDKRFNRIFIPYEQCVQCGLVLPPNEIVNNNQRCPVCGSQQFTKALRQDGQPEGEWTAYGRGKTSALSPFEYAFPLSVTRFDEIPFIIRLRWRDKHYYEANYPDLVRRIMFEKSPQDRSLQIYKSLSLSNDLGTSSRYAGSASSGITGEEGVTEYELWIKPTGEFPEGFVMRVIGDRTPVLMQAEEEGIPGPVPYKDIEGNPLFPFVFAPFEQCGGRVYGSGALTHLVQKQDQINQIDALSLMIIQRMANPVWVIPEGAGDVQITGDPGLVIKWNPLSSGGQGKPERVSGENVPPSLFQLRNQYLQDFEQLSGAFDILKGNKPAGVEAFAALQLLDERSRARFTSAFIARGELYKHWFELAVELERKFGPQQRVRAIVGPNKTYTFQQFQKAKLQGNIAVHIEGGTDVPKTSLANRAAIEHANQLRMIDPADPEQKYVILADLGLSKLVPSIDIHVQTALQMQDAFEKWVQNPVGLPPLNVKLWYNPQIHWTERVKWLNSDRMRDLMAQRSDIEQLVTAHLQELQMVLTPPLPVEQPPQEGVGAGRAMQNSNTNAGSPTLAPEAQATPQQLIS